MRAKRIDRNQPEIVKKLRQIPGVSVAVTSALGDGFPDLVIGVKKNGLPVNLLIELKDGDKPPSQQRITEDEKDFIKGWRGQVAVCNCFDDVLKLITA
jgi:hypothetical protein